MIVAPITIKGQKQPLNQKSDNYDSCSFEMKYSCSF